MEQNNRQNVSEPLRYQDQLIDRTLTQDISQELSLPDYQPEIKRLLRITATPQPPTRYIGGGNIEFSGNVDFNILYAGEDGALYCFPASADYTMRTSTDADGALAYLPDDNMTCYALLDTDMVSCRVAGPRKLTARCRMHAHIRAYGTAAPEEIWQGTLCGTPQRLREEMVASRVLCGTSEPILLRDEILPDRPEDTDTLRLISAEASVLPEEITTATDRITCRGQTALKLLLQRDATSEDDTPPLPTTILRKLPFSAEIPVSGLLSGGDAIVNGSCTELHLTLEDGKIACELEMLLEARTQHREMISYTRDLCIVGQHATVETTQERITRPLRSLSSNFSQNEIVQPKDSGIPQSATLIDVCGTPIPDSIALTTEGNRCVISGNCRYSIIYSNEGELASRELELPFRCTSDLGSTTQFSPDALCYDHSVRVVGCRARLDERDGRLSIDTELGIALRLWEVNSFSPVSLVHLEESCTKPTGSRTIYYPLPDETLWSVAKRYCSSVEQLALSNKLSGSLRADDPASLRGVHIMVI